MRKWLMRMEGCSEEFTAENAEEAREYAEDWVRDGDYGDITKTTWISCYVKELCSTDHSCDHAQINANGACEECGERCSGVAIDDGGICYDTECHVHGDYTPECDCDLDDRERIKVELEPEEPECLDAKRVGVDHGHHWLDLGGPQGHGGGVWYKEVCALCGLVKDVDTWAQDPETGEQGLTSVEYLEEREDVVEDTYRDGDWEVCNEDVSVPDEIHVHFMGYAVACHSGGDVVYPDLQALEEAYQIEYKEV